MQNYEWKLYMVHYESSESSLETYNDIDDT